MKILHPVTGRKRVFFGRLSDFDFEVLITVSGNTWVLFIPPLPSTHKKLDVFRQSSLATFKIFTPYFSTSLPFILDKIRPMFRCRMLRSLLPFPLRRIFFYSSPPHSPQKIFPRSFPIILPFDFSSTFSNLETFKNGSRWPRATVLSCPFIVYHPWDVDARHSFDVMTVRPEVLIIYCRVRMALRTGPTTPGCVPFSYTYLICR